MKRSDLLILVASNLLRMKARVGMTVAGVLIGSSAVILLIALGLGLQHNALESLGEMGDMTLLRVYLPQGVELSMIDHRTAFDTALLDSENIDLIRSLPGVTAVTEQVHVSTLATLRWKTLELYPPVFGIDPLVMDTLNVPLASGQASPGPGQVILGGKAAASIFDSSRKEYVVEDVNWQDQIVDLILTRYLDSNTSENRRYRVQIAGVLEETGGFIDYGVFVPLDDAIRWNTWIKGKPFDHARYGYECILVKTETASASYNIERELSAMTFRVDTNRKMLAQMDQFFQFIQLMLGGIGAIALLVSAFGIANTMIMAIYERTREIGLLKALGAKNVDILLIFITEAAAIGLLGGLSGVGAAFGIAELSNSFGAAWLNKIPNVMGPPGSIPGLTGKILFDMPVWLMAFSVGFSTVVGVLSGLYPAMRAASLDPLMALRHE